MTALLLSFTAAKAMEVVLHEVSRETDADSKTGICLQLRLFAAHTHTHPALSLYYLFIRSKTISAPCLSL